MQLTPSQVSFIASLHAEDWAGMVVDAVREWLRTDRVTSAFGPLATVLSVDQDSDVAVALAEFYVSLAHYPECRSAQPRFRSGIDRAIRACVVRWPGYPELESLLGIVREINTGETNQALVFAAQSDGFNALRLAQQHRLFGLMIAILRHQVPTSKSSPREAHVMSVSETMEALSLTPTFPLDLVFMAFAVLARSDPSRIVEHLDLLEEPLQLLRKDGKEFPPEWLSLLRAFAAQFPPPDEIEAAQFGWAIDWLYDQQVNMPAPEPQQHHLARVARKVLRMADQVAEAVARRTTRGEFTLSAQPPEGWTPPSREAHVEESDAATT